MKPIDFDKSNRYPLIVSLHGGGGKGTDNRKATRRTRTSNSPRKSNAREVSLLRAGPAGERLMERNASQEDPSDHQGVSGGGHGQALHPRTLDGTKAVEVFRGDPARQIYAMPVFRYAGVYIGLPVIFQPETDRSHTELAWSSDTIHWHRIDPGTPLIPTSSIRDAYDWGCVYGAACPVVREDEIPTVLRRTLPIGPLFFPKTSYSAAMAIRSDCDSNLTQQHCTLFRFEREVARMRMSLILPGICLACCLSAAADTGTWPRIGPKSRSTATSLLGLSPSPCHLFLGSGEQLFHGGLSAASVLVVDAVSGTSMRM